MTRVIPLILICALSLGGCSQAGGEGDAAPRSAQAEAKPGTLGAAGARTVVVTPPGARVVGGDLRVPVLHHSGDPAVRARWKSANSDAAPLKPPVPSC